MVSKKKPRRFPPLKMDIHTMRRNLALLRQGKFASSPKKDKRRKPR